MSNPAYSKPGARPTKAKREDTTEEVYSSEEMYAPEEEQSAGLLSSPGRMVALGGSVLVLVAILAVAVLLLTSRKGTGSVDTGVSLPAAQAAPQVGALAPDFNLIDVRTNKSLTLSSLRGKPVWINFWGTWCPPCRAEMPEMQKMFDKYKDQVDIIGISMGPRDFPDQVKQFVDDAKYGWTFVHDGQYAVATNYQVVSVPSSYFIDKNGVIRAIHIGGMNSAQMEPYVQQIKQ